MEWRGHEIILSVIKKLNENGSWCGKTHIIKTLYLLKASKRMDIPFDFILYKHGPYSFDVEDTLAIMKSYDAIEGIDTCPGVYGECLNPGKNADFPHSFAQLKEKEQKAISEICKLTGKKDVKELERLATAAWIVNQERETDSNIIARRVHELKPHITKKQARDAYHEIIPFLP